MPRAWRRRPRREQARRPLGDESGSILPLALAYAVLCLTALFVCVDATSLYLSQKRLDGLADAAALAGADGFTLEFLDGRPRARLSDDQVRIQAQALLAATTVDAVLVSAATPDGSSARVTVAGVWHPPIGGMLVPDGIALQSTATSRTALR